MAKATPHQGEHPMLIGYARVSTPDQKLDLQLDALQRAGCERLFQDVMSSTRLDRPGLDVACSHLRAGDTLVVYKLDRLGRSVKGPIAFTEMLKARGVAMGDGPARSPRLSCASRWSLWRIAKAMRVRWHGSLGLTGPYYIAM